jgi:hypothetical protein
MNVFTKSEYGLPASIRPSGRPEREPSLESVLSSYGHAFCEFEPACVIKMRQAGTCAVSFGALDHTFSADQCIQASHLRG